MSIDFDDLFGSDKSSKLVQPLDIFSTLAKKNPRFSYPRDVQAQVLAKWFARRSEKDLVIRMNTGAGKTAVGLLMLQSCINEGAAPGIFIAANNFLVEQVCKEAKDLGISVSQNPDDPSVLRGDSILVSNIHTIFNGRSKFGVNTIKIQIGSLLIDDAHACMQSVQDQFTLTLASSNPTYKLLLKLFEDDLKAQSPVGFYMISAGDPTAAAQIPFWAWQSKLSEVIKIISQDKEKDSVFNPTSAVWRLPRREIRGFAGVSLGAAGLWC